MGEQIWVIIVLGLCVGLSVCASAGALIAWSAADPLRVRKLSATVDSVAAEVEDGFKHMRDVELARIVAQCESVLERADDRFDSAERKRRSVAGQKGGAHRAEADLSEILADPSISRPAKISALRQRIHGAG